MIESRAIEMAPHVLSNISRKSKVMVLVEEIETSILTPKAMAPEEEMESSVRVPEAVASETEALVMRIMWSSRVNLRFSSWR